MYINLLTRKSTTTLKLSVESISNVLLLQDQHVQRSTTEYVHHLSRQLSQTNDKESDVGFTPLKMYTVCVCVFVCMPVCARAILLN